MLSLEDVNDGETPCQRCKGQFRVVLPVDWYASEKLASLLKENRLGFIEALKTRTGCTLVDAKGTMQHFATTPGTCHWCAGPLTPSEAILECPRCRSLNLQFPRGDDAAP